MEKDYTSSRPLTYSLFVVLIFGFTSMVFCFYDVLVERRQRKVLRTAEQSSAIVSSLFPSVIRDRLFPDQESHVASNEKDKRGIFKVDPKFGRSAFLQDGNKRLDQSQNKKSAPIADMFPETTVMFADIAGFTSWSAVREPTQVFILLETVYCAFDTIAKRRAVFKVETIGDSYVAVCGLPEPNPQHALVMAKFANDCRDQMNKLSGDLEASLGPGTSDLTLRFGLNSGPVTAGVLRGDKSRFQLFGDTVNTAARMESTGIKNMIQVSESTAALINAAGKEHWITKRQDLVEAKGTNEIFNFDILHFRFIFLTFLYVSIHSKRQGYDANVLVRSEIIVAF
jgi:class 3 adenylate cyclase